MAKKQLVTYVRLHSTLYVKGVGELKATLPPDNKTIPGLEMSESPSGILCKNDIQTFVIPYATISVYAHGRLVDEPQAEKPAAPEAPKPGAKKSA